MYTSYFGLSESPFSITPDPRYLYMSERHREGLAHLLYGIRRSGGFVQLTGEVGTGKTTLCRCLLAQLPPEVDVAFILNPRLTVVELLATVCDELCITYPPQTRSVKILVDHLYRRLLEAHGRGRRTVLVIDEAQNLAADVLEQVRLLTNLETTTEKLLQIILIGQPELAQLLERRKLRQLAQRITARYHLLPLSKPETCAYIRHRVRVAGGSDSLFRPAAMRRVYRLSGGVPRMINVICDRALLGAYAHERDRVEAATVRQAGREVFGMVPRARRCSRLGWVLGLGAVGLAIFGMTILATPGRISSPGEVGLRPAGDAGPTAVRYSHGEDHQTTEEGRADAVSRQRPAADATDGRASKSRTLVQLLTDPSIRGDVDTAFASVYSRWGAEYPRRPAGLPCEAGRSMGLECVSKTGSWNKLRRFNLPAVLNLDVPSAGKHSVALVALGEETATLALGGQEYTFPLGEVDQFWDGEFTLLRKVPPFGSRMLALGTRGEDVEWLRRKLDEMDGTETKVPRPEIYDQTLQQRVRNFQRSRSLVPDGVVGEETLAQLSLAMRDPGTPSLLRRAP